MAIQRGDIVTTERHPTHMGLVIRAAKNGAWVDVDWFGHSKRMKPEHLIKPKEVPCPGLSGDGYTVTLIQVDLPAKGA